jgi:hypothetical protein
VRSFFWYTLAAHRWYISVRLLTVARADRVGHNAGHYFVAGSVPHKENEQHHERHVQEREYLVVRLIRHAVFPQSIVRELAQRRQVSRYPRWRSHAAPPLTLGTIAPSGISINSDSDKVRILDGSRLK